MTRHELLSIGIPVLNGEQTVGRVIRSALLSEYRPLEIVVSDNCSTDATPDIVADLAREHPEIQHHRTKETGPLGVNWNRAVQLSSGSYFKFAPHDDFFSADYVGTAIKALEGDPDAVVAYGRAVYATEKGAVFGVTDDREPGVVGLNPRRRVHTAMKAIRSYPAVNQGVVRREAMDASLGFPNVETMDRLRVAEFAMMGNIRLISDPILVIQIPENRIAKNEFLYNDPANAERLRLRLLRIAGAFNDVVDNFTSDPGQRIELKTSLAYSYLRRRVVKRIEQRRHRDDQTRDRNLEALRLFVDAAQPDGFPGAIKRYRHLREQVAV